MRRIAVLALLTATVALTGCPKKNAVKDTSGATSTTDSASSSSTDSSGLDNGQSLNGGQNADQAALMANRVIYFDLDSAEIRSDSRDAISGHARNLAANANTKARLEGHADERGSREYNIGLGERRAQAVRRALMLQGAGDAQIATVSYGEERPAASGSDEDAWSKNRRVEIVYGN